MHFSKIVKKDYINAASIGGLTYGCSALEMASGFATLENDGKFRDPTCIVKILDSEGNTVVEDHVDETYIYDSKAANTMVDMMEGVFTRGTARGLGLDTGIVCAGKTGTTNDHKDGWFCGFTPYYTTAVWIGCDTPTVISDLSGSTYPGRTWNTFMNEIHKDLENKVFPFEEKEESDSSDSSSSKSYSSQGYSSSSRATATPKAKKPKETKPAIVENRMIFIRMTKQIVPEIPRRAAEIQVITPAAIAAVETVAERMPHRAEAPATTIPRIIRMTRHIRTRIIHHSSDGEAI